MKSKISFVFLTLFCLVITAKAQVVEQMISHFNKLKNLSYKSTTISKDFFSDKLYFDTVQSVITMQPQLAFKMKGTDLEDIYDGNKLSKLQFSDRTYRISTDPTKAANYDKSLPYLIKRIDGYLKKGIRPVRLKDSVINGVSYFHVKIKDLDSIKNNKPVFSETNLLIDKKTYLLSYFRNDSKGFIDGTNIHLTVFNEYHFSHYQLNAAKLPDLRMPTLPANFTTEKPKLPLLAKGAIAPEIPLYTLNGQSLQRSALKGKVLLLNFTDNGCPHCVEAIETLNKLQERYQSADFALISINLLDDKASILKFDQSFGVKYPTYTSDKTTLETYRVQAYPLFYLIDKSGKITYALNGFSADLGKQLEQEVKNLLK